LLQSDAQVAAGRMKRRNQSDRHSDQCGDAHSKREYGAIHVNRAQSRKSWRTERRQRPHAELRNDHPESPAEGGEHQAFGEQLPDHPRSRGAERGAHSEFAAPLRAAAAGQRRGRRVAPA
jgi:hypothetical protein